MNATITLTSEAGLTRMLDSDQKQLPRGSYQVVDDGKQTTISLHADDVVALRAVFSAIIKQLIIWEGSKSL